MGAPENLFRQPQSTIILKQWADELPAKLADLKPGSTIQIFDGREPIAEIGLIAASPGIPLHFVVRPGKCTPDILAKKNAELVFEPSSQAFPITPGTAGGHYIPGIVVKISDLYVTLPELQRPETGAVSFSSLSGTSLPTKVGRYPEWACVYHGKRDTQLAAEQLVNGSVAVLIGNGGRSSNQDIVGYTKKGDTVGALFVLDGNRPRGDVAAQIIAERVTNSLEAGGKGGTALESGSKYLGDYLQKNPNRPRGDMGTCALVFDIEKASCTTSHIGDCRGIVLRQNDNNEFTIIHKTVDHSLSEELRRMGAREETINAYRGVLSRGISLFPSKNSNENHDVSADISLKPGDLLIGMSDGGQIIPEQELLQICSREQSPERIIAACSIAVDTHSAQTERTVDNYSLVVFRYDPKQ